MSNYPQIATVAAGSRALQSGLQSVDELIEINGVDTFTLLDASPQRPLLADQLEQQLAQPPPDSILHLTIRSSGLSKHVQISPLQSCAARVVVKTGLGFAAFIDGRIIAVSSKLIDFVRNDDELALVMRHERAQVNNGGGVRLTCKRGATWRIWPTHSELCW